MAILEFKGAIQEWSGARQLEARLGVTVDQSLRYLNDNGYDGIYDPIAEALQQGKARAFDAATGHQVGLSDYIEERAVIVPVIAGGNGGGGATWTLMSSVSYPAGTWMSYCYGPPNAAGSYASHPNEGSFVHRWAVWNGAAWETQATWSSSTFQYPGYVQLAREGFTAQSSSIGHLEFAETWNAYCNQLAMNNYGAAPLDTQPQQYPAVLYRGTGRIADTVVQ